MKPYPNRLKIRLPFAGAALVTAIAVCLGSTALAVDNLWTGTVDQDWNNTGNWSLGRVPANPNGQPTGDTYDDAVINMATGNYPYVTANTGATPRDVMLGRGAGNSGQLDQVSGEVTYNGWFYIGRSSATGVYNLADVATAGSGVTGYGMGSGSLTRTAAGRLWVGGTWSSEGTGGNGTFNVNTSGTITVNDLAVGSGGSKGVMNVDAGTINTTGWNFIGKREGADGADGTLTMAGGTLSNTGNTFIGETGCTGTLVLSGGSYKNVNNNVFRVGGDNNDGLTGSGTGNIVINNSASLLQSTGELQLGDQAGAQGTIDLSDGAITVNNYFAIGRRGGKGILNMSGGTVTKTGGGVVTISTGTNGTGEINQSGGTFTNTTSATFLGESWNGDGFGTWNLTGGDAVLGELVVGNGGACRGTFNLDGGTLWTTKIRDNTTGATNFNFNGGTLKARATESAFMAGLDAATVQGGGAVIDTNGFDITIAQALLDGGTGGGVTKNGAGTLIFAGTNIYTGPNVVNAGKLVMRTRGGTPPNAGDITVADGATLGVAQTGSTVSLSVLNATFGSAGDTSLDIDLGNIAGNPLAAPFKVTGTLTLNGTVTINIADQMPAIGTIPLVTYVTPKSGTGSFVLGTLPNGVIATLNDDTTTGVVSLTVTSISLPKWLGSVDGITPDGTWDVGTTQNWIDMVTSLPTTYTDPAPVLFPDNFDPTTFTPDVTLDVTVTPSTVTFNNFLDVYTLSGTGKISGTGSLLKQGSALVTISTLNDYTGTTTVEATDDPSTVEVVAVSGTLSVNSIANGGVASAIGASSADPANLVLKGSTLEYTGPAVSIDRGFTIAATGSGISTVNDLTMSGLVATIGGNLVKTGAGNLTLTNPGANVFGTVNQGLKVNGGTLTLDGGVAGTQTNAVAGELWLASTPDVPANLVLNKTSLTTTSWFAMGRGNGATGTVSTLTATDSVVTTVNFSTGHDAGLANDSDQIVTLTDTTWTNNGVTYLAENANATTTMDLVGTTVFNANGRFSIGLGNNSLATVTLKDSAQLIQTGGGWVSIGNGGTLGTGILNIQDNAVASFSNVDFNISDVGTSVGTVNISGAGTLTVAGTAYIGKNTGTSGTVNLASGSVTTAQSVYIGSSTGATGLVEVTGGTFTGGGTNEFQIGSNGQGTWNQSDGTANAGGWVAIGRYTGSVGVATISGGTFNQTGTGNQLLVGEAGTGTLTISGTAVVNSLGNSVTISNADVATGTVNLDGGTLTARQITAGASGAGLGYLNFNGGLLVAGTGANASFINNLDAATVLAGGAYIDSNGQTIAIDQALVKDDPDTSGGLVKSGVGTLLLNGVNTYTGVTQVNEGTLGGTGSLAGTLMVPTGTTLAPGTSVGTFTTVDVLLSGTMAVEIDGATADKLVVNGSLTIDNTSAVLAVTQLSAPTVAVYVIATYTGPTPAAFSSVTGLPDGYSVVYDYDDGITNTNIALVGTPTGYASWAATNAGGQAADLDFDNDGVLNGVEFFMGETGSTFTANPGVVDGKVTWPKSAGFTGTYAVETSPDLATWTPQTEGVVDNGTSVEYTLPTGEVRLFLRLAVTPQ